MYKDRYYRKLVYNKSFKTFEIKYYESNLLISSSKNLEKSAKKWLVFFHGQIHDYIEKNPEFEKSLKPLKFDPAAAPIIQEMLLTSTQAHVGPMATVAGAIAEFVGLKLLDHSEEVIVENGGDIFISVKKDCRVGIFAGIGNTYNKLAVIIRAKDTPCGICASSGKIGHSLSFGKSDATIVIADNAALADGYATAIGNLVSSGKDFKKAVRFAGKNKEVKGLIIIIDGKLTAYGNICFDILDKRK